VCLPLPQSTATMLPVRADVVRIGVARLVPWLVLGHREVRQWTVGLGE